MSVVIRVGAGATVADASRLPYKKRPPLDRGFFGSVITAKDDVASQSSLRTIQRYMSTHYNIDILHPEEDSLEAVLARIYTDVFNAALESEAARTFRTLIYLWLYSC